MPHEAAAGGEPATGSVELEVADLRSAVLEMSWLSRSRVGITIVLALAYGALAFTRHLTARELAQQAVFGGILLFFLFVAPHVRASRLLRTLTEGGDVHASFRFDDDGLTMRTAGSTKTTPYDAFVGYRDVPSAFLLYSAPGVANVVPKRAFSAEGLTRVSALLSTHVKKRATP